MGREIDEFIEKNIFNHPEPVEDFEVGHGWTKENELYCKYDYDADARCYFIIDIWPREFSESIYLAWQLAEMYHLSLSPLISSEDKIIGWEASGQNITMEGKTAAEAICLTAVALKMGES